jgi:hypothetical protein
MEFLPALWVDIIKPLPVFRIIFLRMIETSRADELDYRWFLRAPEYVQLLEPLEKFFRRPLLACLAFEPLRIFCAEAIFLNCARVALPKL